MQTRFFRTLFAGVFALCMVVSGWAADRLIPVDTRPDVTTSYWWMPREGAMATVLLFSGGAGGIGYRDGEPKSGNFLIRSRDEFAKAGLNVALIGNPSDMPKLTPTFRQSPEHFAGVRAVVQDIHARSYVRLVGGQNPTGPPCEAFHYHGYIEMEPEAVAQISAWIKHPVP